MARQLHTTKTWRMCVCGGLSIKTCMDIFTSHDAHTKTPSGVEIKMHSAHSIRAHSTPLFRMYCNYIHIYQWSCKLREALALFRSCSTGIVVCFVVSFSVLLSYLFFCFLLRGALCKSLTDARRWTCLLKLNVGWCDGNSPLVWHAYGVRQFTVEHSLCTNETLAIAIVCAQICHTRITPAPRDTEQKWTRPTRSKSVSQLKTASRVSSTSTLRLRASQKYLLYVSACVYGSRKPYLKRTFTVSRVLSERSCVCVCVGSIWCSYVCVPEWVSELIECTGLNRDLGFDLLKKVR